MQIPQSASEFVKFMEETWISYEPRYSRYENAKLTAKEFGYKYLWPTMLAGVPAYCYECPDGSRVKVHTDGFGVTEGPKRTSKAVK